MAVSSCVKGRRVGVRGVDGCLMRRGADADADASLVGLLGCKCEPRSVGSSGLSAMSMSICWNADTGTDSSRSSGARRGDKGGEDGNAPGIGRLKTSPVLKTV